MYKRILVPLDGSKMAEAVLPLAERLANGLGAGMVLLNVQEEEGVFAMQARKGGALVERPDSSIAARCESYLQDVAGRVKSNQGPVGTLLAVGNVPSVIIQEAESVPDTLIAMCTHGSSGVDRFVMGSVATDVLHSTKVPLLLLRPGEAEPATAANLKAVVVPLDGSKLAEQSLPQAELLAGAFGLSVLLVRVTPTLAEFYGPLGGDALYVPAGLFEGLEKEAVAYLSAKAAELKGRGVAVVEAKHVQGRAAPAILDLVRDTPGCIVIITTHGRSGLGRWMLGSVADRLVSHSSAPVMVIRPSQS